MGVLYAKIVERYLMSKIKTIVGLFDIHLRDTEPHPAYQLARKFIATIEPDEIILGGDFMDCQSLSHWNDNKKLELEGTRYEKEVANANYELDILGRYAKKITYLVGNHEDWLYQYVEKNPQMAGFINLEKNLRLKERGIQLVPLNDLYATGALYWTHGQYINKYHAAKHYERLGCSVIYGHAHTFQAHSCNQRMQEPFVSVSIGCLCGDDFSYLKNKYPSWIEQFVVVYVNSATKHFNIIPITIIDNSFMWNGRLFK